MHRLLLLVVILSGYTAWAQTPKIVLQQNFENGINRIHQSPDGKHFLVEEGTVTKRFSIWDQAGKIMLGSLELNPGNAQGAGHINFLNEGEMLLATNHAILKANLITGDTTTFIKVFNYPEFHLKFESIPWERNKIIFPSKIYGEKDENISDITNNGRLVVYDIPSQKIIFEKNVDYEITEIAFKPDKRMIALGTNQGECLLMDSAYQIIKKVKLTENPLLFLDISLEDMIIANANASEDHHFSRGLGELVFYKPGKGEKNIHRFEKQKPSKKVDKFIRDMYGEDNLVNTILVNPGEKAIYVNFGHNSIERINPFNLKAKKLKLPDYESVSYMNFNKDSSQLLIAHGNLNMMMMSNNLSIYDLANEKEAFAFKNFESPDQPDDFYLVYDEEGNYHFISRKTKTGSFNRYDSLIVFSSNRTNSNAIICKDCNFSYYPSSNRLTAFNDDLMITGQFHLSQLKDKLSISMRDKPQMISDSMVYEKTTEKRLDEILPGTYTLYDFQVLNTERYMICNVSEYHKKQDKKIFRIIDGGDIILEKTFEHLPNFRISNDERYIAFDDGGFVGKSELFIYNLETQKIIFKEKFKHGIQHFDFDLQNPVLYVSYVSSDKENSENYFLYRMDLRENNFNLIQVDTSVEFFSFVADEENNLIAGEVFDKFFVYDLINNKVIYEEQAEIWVEDVTYIHGLEGFGFNLGNRYHIYRDPARQVDFFVFNDGLEAVIGNEGYYYINKDVMRNFGFSLQGKGYSVADFDYYLNRPDILYELLDGSNPDHLALLKEAQKKRSTGSNGTELHALIGDDLPQLIIPNKHKLPDYTDSGHFDIPVEVIDMNSGLNGVQVIVNEVPVFGRNGLPANVQAGQRFRDTIRIELSGGINKFRIFCENKDGLKSLPETWEIFRKEEKRKPDLYVNLISVSDYQQSQFDLQYAVKDGQDLAKLFKEHSKEFNKVIITTLFNEEVNRQNVLALKEKLLQTNVDDQVILFVSGHGLLDDNFDFYFATHDIDFKNPAERGVSYEELEWLLDSIPARKKLFLMDACHSGEVDKEELLAYNAEKEKGIKSGVKKYTYRADVLQYEETGSGLGLQNSFELMQELFTNLKRGSGAVVISAAAGDSYAMESEEWQNGVFTYSILQGLQSGDADANQNGEITVSELRDYVGKTVYDLTNGFQKPTMRQENVEFDYRVW
ncbi:MAG: caspase family protein [Bacteroidales bacterium]|nr:caspase family protein [Bacteroidales bacterium]MCF8343380.1 caspase family protein [Bacteroidales bacterium]MCF8350474.1 caspase family protein [Bacteroidales bacterium]MCF8375481.1 caspase family protein [Bacteroidales bacterium]MCF8399880.1 caspase family protein [Bacteroidales bacterium]